LGIKIHRCDQCEYETTVLVCLKRHKVTKHQLETEHLRCDLCNYETLRKYDLKMHIQRKHTSCEDIKWLKCTQCEYKTKIRGYLNRHERTHTVSNRRKFKC